MLRQNTMSKKIALNHLSDVGLKLRSTDKDFNQNHENEDTDRKRAISDTIFISANLWKLFRTHYFLKALVYEKFWENPVHWGEKG